MPSTPSLGIDIEEIRRFVSLARNKRFMARVYSAAEIAYCRTKKNRAQHLAVRFAAKEAVWKAISHLLHERKLALSHRDVSVANDSNGKPRVVLPKKFRTLEKKLTISLSHSREYAAAVALYHG